MSFVPTLAPRSSNICTTVTRPLTQAQPRAVSPSLSLVSKIDPLSRNSSIRLVWPSEAASINAVRPARSRCSRSDIASSNITSVLVDKSPEKKFNNCKVNLLDRKYSLMISITSYTIKKKRKQTL